MLLTHSGDFFTIDRVQQALVREGWVAVRLDTDTFPLSIALAVERTQAGVEAVLELPERSVRLSQVDAVWLRRLWTPQLPSMAPDDRDACIETSRTALQDTLVHLTDCHWVNALEPSMRAESKVLQLRVAHELGFDLADTTITNSPGWVERLRAREPRLVTKLLVPLSYAMQADRFFYTSQLDGEAYAQLHRIKYAPQIFQPLVEKAHELRVVVVGDETFTASIDASKTERGRVDWRQLDANEGVTWARATLPAPLRARIFRLMKRLGLVSGALDFIVTPDGRHVFLEVNPAGEWGWLERDLGYDISGAFARALIQGARRP
ncbi:MAG: MvdC family ATP-grasp ribosomal peptide maturase [Archangium sp.]|nr:MvdC family ATP-grasp ribosomal peptide maturase [Archangium sp.]